METVAELDDFVQDGSLDNKGKTATRAGTGGTVAAAIIVGPELTEKIAVTSLVANFVPYLTGSLHLTSSNAANLVTTYQGTSYMCTLVGGFIADSFAGRFWVIVGGLLLQLIGLVLLVLSATLDTFRPPYCVDSEHYSCPTLKGWDINIIYLAVYFLALGTGGIKACGSPFGADQFEADNPEEKKQLLGFFNKYVFGITTGAVFGVTVLVYLQDKIGRGAAYSIPAALMAFCNVAFTSAKPWYRFKPVKGSPLTQICQVFVAAFKNRNLPIPAALYEGDDNDPNFTKICHTDQFRFLDKAAILQPALQNEQNSSAVGPWECSSVTKVEEVKMVVRVLPIMATTSLFYTVFAQMTTFSVAQAVTLDREFWKGFTLPAASMATFLHGGILLTLFLWQNCVMPIFHKLKGEHNTITSLQKIGVGLSFSVIGMVVAYLTENERLSKVRSQGVVDKPHTTLHLTVLLLAPQYLLVGGAQALVYAGQLDFFYNESPEGMRSMGTALSVCTLAIGYYFSSILVDLTNRCTGHLEGNQRVGEWLPDHINKGRLDNFYATLALISLMNFLVYLVCAQWYKYASSSTDCLDDSIQSTIYTDVENSFDESSFGSKPGFEKSLPSIGAVDLYYDRYHHSPKPIGNRLLVSRPSFQWAATNSPTTSDFSPMPNYPYLSPASPWTPVSRTMASRPPRTPQTPRRFEDYKISSPMQHVF